MNGEGGVLLIGRNGQIGWELERTLAPLGQVTAVGRSEMDLSDPDAVRLVMRRIRPRLVVNAGAYTAVEQAEAEPELAAAVNAVAPGVLAEEAKRLGAALIHYSTDYVFDGSKREPYTEEDAPNPLNVYGRTKLEGEEAVRAVDGAYVIFRTTWVYGARGRNFLVTVLRRARSGLALRVVNDQTGAPTWSRLVAEATAQFLGRQGDAVHDTRRVYHLAAGGETTWYGFASAILAGLPGGADLLSPLSSEEYPSPVRRPSYSVLSSANFSGDTGVHLPEWRESLPLVLAEMLAEEEGSGPAV